MWFDKNTSDSKEEQKYNLVAKWTSAEENIIKNPSVEAEVYETNLTKSQVFLATIRNGK